MDFINIISKRKSKAKLKMPYPTQKEMRQIYQAAFRAPDHRLLRPTRFIEVTGDGLTKLSKIFTEFATKNNFSEERVNKFKIAPFRAPMIIVAISTTISHNKVPKIEQLLSTGAAIQNILLALDSINYGAIWRTGKLALNDGIKNYFNLDKNSEILGYIYVGTPKDNHVKIPQININKYITKWD